MSADVIELERAAREDVPPETRLCVDCKHMRLRWLSGLRECGRYQSPVDGKPKWLCSTARSFSNLCGPEGRFWEKP